MTEPVDDHATDSEVEEAVTAAVVAAVEAAAEGVGFVGGLVVPPVFEIEQMVLEGLASSSGRDWYQDLVRDAAEWARGLAEAVNRELREVVGGAVADGGSKAEGRRAADRVAMDERWSARAEVWAATVTTMYVNRSRAAAFAAGGLKKKWVARTDSRTRTSHRGVDGTTAHASEYFTVGGYRGLYPGDPVLPPSERMNCRCRIVAE